MNLLNNPLLYFFSLLRDSFFFFIIYFLPLFFFASCHQPDIITFDVPTKVAIQTLHHELIIPECEVYVQYHADQNEFPGFENYAGFDTLFYTDDFGRVTLNDLPLGTHWLYGRGYDDEQMFNVKGVLKIELSIQNPTLDTILYVGEE